MGWCVFVSGQSGRPLPGRRFDSCRKRGNAFARPVPTVPTDDQWQADSDRRQNCDGRHALAEIAGDACDVGPSGARAWRIGLIERAGGMKRNCFVHQWFRYRIVNGCRATSAGIGRTPTVVCDAVVCVNSNHRIAVGEHPASQIVTAFVLCPALPNRHCACYSTERPSARSRHPWSLSDGCCALGADWWVDLRVLVARRADPTLSFPLRRPGSLHIVSPA